MKKPKLIFLNHTDAFNVSPVIALLLTSFAKNGHLIQALNGNHLVSKIVPWASTQESIEDKLALIAEHAIVDCSLVITNYISSVEEIAELRTQLLSFGTKKGLFTFYDICFIQIRDTSKKVINSDAIQMTIVNQYAGHVFSESIAGCAHAHLTPEACLVDILALLAKSDQKVAVAGKSISGKGTITDGFGKVLGYNVFSAGNDVSRILADEKNMTIEELVSSYGNDEKGRCSYDKAIDDRLFKELTEVVRSVCEGRMTGYFAKKADPKIFRVYMEVSPENAAERLFKIPPGGRKASYNFPTQEAAAVGIEQRNKEDMKAYLRTYKYDYTDTSNYHVVIDTNTISKHQMFPQLLQRYISFLIAHIK